MKTDEVLKAYADGRRDFSRENLRGQSFKGKNLSGANFSEADIKGANFTNAKLTGVNFTGAKAGLQRRWTISLVITSWILSALPGILSVVLGNLSTLMFHTNFSSVIVVWLAVAGAVAVAGGVAVAVPEAVAGAAAVVVLGAYLSWRAFKGDEQYAWIRRFAIAFAATGGTSFRKADLTAAELTSATLKNTDFRNAILTRTNLHQTKKLDYARVGDTILIDAKVRDLVVTHRGAKQSYIGCNLKGANLTGADLNDADLTEADISGANLQQAWLERANLTKTQALNTNFNQANLTGACLEAWNIDSTTQLDAAICDYVYLLNNQKERRPNSGEFAPGEFTKLF